jgi:hypothetical protein
MSEKSISRVKYDPSIWTNIADDRPIIVEDIFDVFPSFQEMSVAVQEAIKTSEDFVGFVSSKDGECREVRICDISNTPGYINGWEYMGGDCAKKFSPFLSDLESIISPTSFLKQIDGQGSHQLDIVMKWLFISIGSGSKSDWHIDPIGSAAWMIQLVGEKIWYTRDRDEVVSVGRIKPGELILIPPGLEHRVENVTLSDDYTWNIAVWLGKSC